MSKSPEQQLIDKFYEGLRDWDEEAKKEWESKGGTKWNEFRISSLGQCSRLITYESIKGRGEMSPESLQRLSDGDAAHTQMRELLSRSANIDDEEVLVSKKFKAKWKGEEVVISLSGHIDNTVVLGKERFIVDYKKSERNSFEKIQKTGLPDAYYEQMMGYLFCAPKEWRLKGGLVFLKPTHGVEPEVFLVEKDPSYFKKMLSRLAMTALCRKKKKLAPREYSYGLPPCSYCQWQNKCWSLLRTPKEGEATVKGKDLKKLREALEENRIGNELEEESAEHKSKAKALALEVLNSSGAKKIVGPKGERATYVAYGRTVDRWVDKAEAFRQGLVKKDEIPITLVRFGKGK